MYVIVMSDSALFGKVYYAGNKKSTRLLSKALKYEEPEYASMDLENPFFKIYKGAYVMRIK